MPVQLKEVTVSGKRRKPPQVTNNYTITVGDGGYLYKKYGNGGGLIEDQTQPIGAPMQYDSGMQGFDPVTAEKPEAPLKVNSGEGWGKAAPVMGLALSMGADFIGSRQRELGQYENYKAGSQQTSQAAAGAMSGAASGMKYGPVGALIGGVVGGGLGYFKGSKMEKDRKQEVASMGNAYKESVRQSQLFDATKNKQYFDTTRNAQMYGNGGELPLSAKFLSKQNSQIQQTSSDTTLVHGEPHESGGVPLQGIPAELEKGETTKGDYVFSEKLGFAKMHKPIAVAKGKIEKQPMTPERANSLKLLNRKEEVLKASQEMIKNVLNLQ